MQALGSGRAGRLGCPRAATHRAHRLNGATSGRPQPILGAGGQLGGTLLRRPSRGPQEWQQRPALVALAGGEAAGGRPGDEQQPEEQQQQQQRAAGPAMRQLGVPPEPPQPPQALRSTGGGGGSLSGDEAPPPEPPLHPLQRIALSFLGKLAGQWGGLVGEGG